MTPLDRLRSDVDQLYGRYGAQQQATATLRQQVTALEAQAQLLTLTEAALSSLLGTVSQQSLSSIEQTITFGLATVFDDHPLSFKFRVSQQRGGQSLEPVLRYGDVEAEVLSSFGGGPASIVAFLLRVLVCRELGLYPLVLLDESFSMVSRQYLANTATLIKELSARLGVTFVLVTHQPEFIQNADRAYEAVETTDGTTFRLVV